MGPGAAWACSQAPASTGASVERTTSRKPIPFGATTPQITKAVARKAMLISRVAGVSTPAPGRARSRSSAWSSVAAGGENREKQDTEERPDERRGSRCRLAAGQAAVEPGAGGDRPDQQEGGKVAAVEVRPDQHEGWNHPEPATLALCRLLQNREQ